MGHFHIFIFCPNLADEISKIKNLRCTFLHFSMLIMRYLSMALSKGFWRKNGLENALVSSFHKSMTFENLKFQQDNFYLPYLIVSGGKMSRGSCVHRPGSKHPICRSGKLVQAECVHCPRPQA